jgi:site-specific recombinase XerD
MRVQRVLAPELLSESWTLLGEGLLPVGPVESFLAYLTAIERSPNTIKAYAHDLKDWWSYIERRGLDWKRVDLEAAAGFVAWLRLSPPARNGAAAVLPTVGHHCAASSV